LLPAATEIVAALGLMRDVVGVSHECDFPEEAKARPRVTHCPVHNAGLTSREVDEWVRQALRNNGTIYTIDEQLLRELYPDVILTQKLCDVCAVGYGTVARLAATLAGPPQVVSLEPTCLSDIFDDIRRVAKACGVPRRAEKLVANLLARVAAVRERTAQIQTRPRCFLMEWIDPVFCSGHWGPELVEIAGGDDPLGRKHGPSAEIKWEAVLEARPEIIVLTLCGYDINRARRDYELLKNFPRFASLPAAEEGIYVVDAGAYFARPGPRIVDSLEILASIIHPKDFPEFSGHSERLGIGPSRPANVAS
jgi:iron complex transport system substrate-binding protein